MLGTKSEAKNSGENVMKKVFKNAAKNFERKKFKTKLYIKTFGNSEKIKIKF
jgi:hypothetical protein